MLNLLNVQTVAVETVRGNWQHASQQGDAWITDSATVRFVSSGERVSVFVSANAPISSVAISWPWTLPAGARILNDHWERGYGDLDWSPSDPEAVLPWYFALASPETSGCVGVRTGARAFCGWHVETTRLRLSCDVRAAREPVELGDRELHIADLVQADIAADESVFGMLRRFCRDMCEKPLLPKLPVYGFNDWYYAYGTSTQETIARDAKILGDLTQGLENRPFCVVDAGYQVGRSGAAGGPFHLTNQFFPDMKGLAADMRVANVRPGLWVRVLRTQERVPDEWIRNAPADRCGDLVDPSVPEAVTYMADQIRPLVDDWGYELVKHDFSTNDIFGNWGFQMGAMKQNHALAPFRNKDRTTAEVILDLYRAIREACGEALIIGCNTVGHLAAGLVEVQRIGDDTSGRVWGRTRKMGVNSLAFRAPQHDAFFAIDADCVGLTNRIPWELNRQWLDLLGRSGTPLFVSADPDALGTEQRDALAAALAANSVPQPLGEPLDWMDTRVPARWLLQGAETHYDWADPGIRTTSEWGN